MVFGGGGGGTAAGAAWGLVSLFFDDVSCELFLVSWTRKSQVFVRGTDEENEQMIS